MYCFRIVSDYEILVSMPKPHEYYLEEYYEPKIIEIKEYLIEKGLEIESIDKEDIVHMYSVDIQHCEVGVQVLKIKTKRIESRELSTAPKGHAV